MSGCDFVPGNTRLRARRPGLLSPAQLEHLPAGSVVELGEALLRTAYRPHLERYGGTFGRAAILRAAVTDRLRENLSGVHGLYGGDAGQVVELLLARHDLTDVVALLRGLVGGVSAHEVAGAVLGVGRVDRTRALDVMAAGDPDAAFARVVEWRLPDPAVARSLPAIWRRYELHDDTAELEYDTAVATVAGWDATTTAVGAPAAPLAALLGDERDEVNVMLALAELADAGVVPPRYLPGGTVSAGRLAEIVGGADPGQVVPRSWRPAIERWREHGDLGGLQQDLRSTRQRRSMAGFLFADPLSAAIPVAYVQAAEAEADTLRALVTRAARFRAAQDVSAKDVSAKDAAHDMAPA